MKKELVSVVVPVYNVEKYINECIESLVNQTYEKIEILLIDDGSSDNSGSICNEWSKKDKRIKVIHKENDGVSSARNLGLDRSVGQYITFVDSDDYIEKNYIETLIKCISKYDMVACGYFEEYLDGKSEQIIANNDAEISIADANDNIFRFDSYKGFTWNKIFKNKIIKENNIRFNTRIHMCEDQLFLVNYLLHCKTVFIIHNCLYNYRIRTSSIASGVDKTKLLTIFDAYEIIKNIYKTNNIECVYFLYSSIWFYCEYKKYTCKQIYNALELHDAKKTVFKSNKIPFIKKIKLFIKIYLPFVYAIRNKTRTLSLNKFE